MINQNPVLGRYSRKRQTNGVGTLYINFKIWSRILADREIGSGTLGIIEVVLEYVDYI